MSQPTTTDVAATGGAASADRQTAPRTLTAVERSNAVLRRFEKTYEGAKLN